MSSFKEQLSNVVESIFMASILGWSVFAGAAALSSPDVTHEPRGTVEIRALNDIA